MPYNIHNLARVLATAALVLTVSAGASAHELDAVAHELEKGDGHGEKKHGHMEVTATAMPYKGRLMAHRTRLRSDPVEGTTAGNVVWLKATKPKKRSTVGMRHHATIIPLQAAGERNGPPGFWDEGPPGPLRAAPAKATRRPAAKATKRPADHKVGFAQRLKMARTAAGYETAAEGARALGIEAATYGRWERAETEPNLAAINAICTAYKVSSDFLVLNRMPE